MGETDLASWRNLVPVPTRWLSSARKEISLRAREDMVQEIVAFPGGTPPRPGPRQARRSEEPRFAGVVLGSRLYRARRAARLTQQQLAQHTCSRRSISAIERGNFTPSLEVVTILAETLVVPVSYLLGEIDIEERALVESSSVVLAAAASTKQIDEPEAQQRLSKAGTFIRQDRADEAWKCLGESDAEPVGWPLLLRPQWAWLTGWTLCVLERPADAVPCLEEGLRLARLLQMRAHPELYASWDEMVAWLYGILGVARCALGQKALAYHCYQQGLQALDQGRVGKAELKLLLYKGLGREYFALARYEEAIGCYKKALAFAADCDNPRQHCLAAWGLAVVYEQQAAIYKEQEAVNERQRQLTWAKVSYLEALKALGGFENWQLLAQLRAHYGLVLVDLKEYEEAERQLQKSLDGARKVDDSYTLGLALACFAHLHNARGEPDQAIRAALASLPFVRKSGVMRAEAQAHFMLITAYTAREDWTAAEQAYLAVIQLAGEIPDHEMSRQAHQGFSAFLADRGRFEEAFEEMERVRTGGREDEWVSA